MAHEYDKSLRDDMWITDIWKTWMETFFIIMKETEVQRDWRFHTIWPNSEEQKQVRSLVPTTSTLLCEDKLKISPIPFIVALIGMYKLHWVYKL